MIITKTTIQTTKTNIQPSTINFNTTTTNFQSLFNQLRCEDSAIVETSPPPLDEYQHTLAALTTLTINLMSSSAHGDTEILRKDDTYVLCRKYAFAWKKESGVGCVRIENADGRGSMSHFANSFVVVHIFLFFSPWKHSTELHASVSTFRVLFLI